jgi:hypothetical protein
LGPDATTLPIDEAGRLCGANGTAVSVCEDGRVVGKDGKPLAEGEDGRVVGEDDKPLPVYADRKLLSCCGALPYGADGRRLEVRPTLVCLELDQITHTLWFVVNGQLLLHCVTNVPADVRFAVCFFSFLFLLLFFYPFFFFPLFFFISFFFFVYFYLCVCV